MTRKPAKKAAKASKPRKAAAPKLPHGRPSKYSDKVAAAICERLSKGEPLAEICRDEGMPAVRTVSLWKETHKEFSADFARAREEGHDFIAADCLRIADTPLPGVVETLEWVTIENPDEPEAPAVKELQVVERKVEDMLGHRKLQIDTRLKLLAKWDKRYNDRLALDHGVQDDLAEKLAAARERAGIR